MTAALSYRPGAPFGEIVLDQPAKRNAISAHMWTSLAEAVRAAENDDGARVVVVRGEGAHFAAGADISEFAHVYETAQSARAYTEIMLGALAALEACGKPTIAAIRGACVGGGCSIALACDMRFASQSARFGITPGRLGLVYSIADTRRLVAAIGAAKAKDLLFTGRLADADEALAMGLCDRVETEAALAGAVAGFAQSLAPVSPQSLRATKAMIRMLGEGARDDNDAAMQLLVDAFSSADFKEGYSAFLEKRQPRFPSS